MWTVTKIYNTHDIIQRDMLTGQLADEPTRGQSSRGLVNLPTANF